MDATRFDQFGHWAGEVRYPDGGIRVEPALCHGTKDRSWGVRNFGKAANTGAPQPPSSLFFIWAPLFWEDHISHALSFEGARGEALAREGLTAPLYKSTAEVPARPATPPGTRSGESSRALSCESAGWARRRWCGHGRSDRSDPPRRGRSGACRAPGITGKFSPRRSRGCPKASGALPQSILFRP